MDGLTIGSVVYPKKTFLSSSLIDYDVYNFRGDFNWKFLVSPGKTFKIALVVCYIHPTLYGTEGCLDLFEIKGAAYLVEGTNIYYAEVRSVNYL